VDHFYENLQGWFDFEDIYSRMVREAASGAHFVEVGAYLGKSTCFMAVEILNSGKNIRFDVVDTWAGSVEHQKGQGHESSLVVEGGLYQAFQENVRPVQHVVHPIRMRSVDAADTYANGVLDFVFIDASHEYEDVVADIRAWRPKVKRGGYIGGHDLQNCFPGVIRAVSEEVPTFEILAFSWLSQVA